MRKNLLTVAALAMSFVANAQFLSYVGDGAVFYVGKGIVVYNGGGMTMQGTGQVENHGNVMVVGTSSDVFKTITADTTPADKTEANAGGNFINKLNEPDAYASVNTTAAPSVYTYGQLYISGLIQNNITGYVDQEYRQVKQGDYQQLAVPFFAKTFSTFSTEFGKTFNNNRRTKNEILVWNNANVEFDNVNVASTSGTPGTNYFSFGSLNLDTSSKVFTLKGRPYAEENTPAVTLKDAGLNVQFGTNGSNWNHYGGAFNTYLQDGFHIASGGTAWNGNYGKNIYQFSNPYLTNLDLKNIAYVENAGTTDGNNLSNIYGIRLDVSGVQYNPNSGGGSTSYKFVTFVDQGGNTGAPSTPAGDVDYLVVRPMGTFVIKMKDNTVPNQTLNFTSLRRFNYLPRAADKNYDVTAAKINKQDQTPVMRMATAKSASSSATASTSGSTLKQLGVIGLDANGNEVARSYYVVYNTAVNGHPNQMTAQVTTATDKMMTFEEEPTKGGYDNNYLGYGLYINEANENTFQGKAIPLALYDTNIKSLKFEIRENAELVADNTTALSSGIGFYYKIGEGNVLAAAQGKTASVTVGGNGADVFLYYGMPNTGTLATDNAKTPSLTRVYFNQEVDNYFVRFDASWKKATVSIYDMSGKLLSTKNNVNTSADYKVELPKTNSVYVITAVSESGAKMSTKIVR